MGAPTGRAPTPALLAVAAIVLLTHIALIAPVPAGLDGTLLANLVAVVTPAVAAWCGWWRARRSTGRRRRAWLALAAATTCWAVGDALWAWLEATGRTRSHPSPTSPTWRSTRWSASASYGCPWAGRPGRAC